VKPGTKELQIRAGLRFWPLRIFANIKRGSSDEQLADDLELLAEERASLGDAREAAVFRERARRVRAGDGDPGWSSYLT
jgi:hypothetical protein